MVMRYIEVVGTTRQPPSSSENAYPWDLSIAPLTKYPGYVAQIIWFVSIINVDYGLQASAKNMHG